MNWTVWASGSESVSLPNIAHQLGESLGTTDFVGGLIATTILFLLFVIPVLYFTKGRNFMIALIIGFLTVCLSVALLWLPVWVLIMLALIVAGLWAGNFRNWLTGHGGN